MNGSWRHYTGTIHKVLGLAKYVKTGERFVVFESVSDGVKRNDGVKRVLKNTDSEIWDGGLETMPMKEFFEVIEHKGKKVLKFEKEN